MKEQLAQYIRANLKKPIEDEIAPILQVFQIKKFEKGDHFKSQGEVCKHLGFVLEGSFKHYGFKKNGNEVTGRVSQRNDFFTDFISIRTKAETPISITAIEPTTILIAPYKDVEALLEVNLTFNRVIREYMASNVVELAKLHMLFLAGTAKERYEFMLQRNPGLLKKIPLRIVASMIGITPTQLSRIRKKK